MSDVKHFKKGELKSIDQLELKPDRDGGITTCLIRNPDDLQNMMKTMLVHMSPLESLITIYTMTELFKAVMQAMDEFGYLKQISEKDIKLKPMAEMMKHLYAHAFDEETKGNPNDLN